MTLYRPIRNDGQTGPVANSATESAIWITQQPDSQLWMWEPVGGALVHIKQVADETLCGIKGRLPDGHTFFFDHEYMARKATCPNCNPEGPRPIGTPISQLSGRPGHTGYQRFCEIAASWGHP